MELREGQEDRKEQREIENQQYLAMGASCQFKQEFESDIVAGESLSAALHILQQTQSPSLHQHHHHHPHSGLPPQPSALDNISLSPQLANQVLLAYKLYAEQTGITDPQTLLESLSKEDIQTLRRLLMLHQSLKSVQQQQSKRSSHSKITGPASSVLSPSTTYQNKRHYSGSLKMHSQHFGLPHHRPSKEFAQQSFLSHEEQHRAVLAAVATRSSPQAHGKKPHQKVSVGMSTATSKSPFPSSPDSPKQRGSLNYKSQKKLPSFNSTVTSGLTPNRNYMSSASSCRTFVGEQESGGGKVVRKGLTPQQAVQAAEQELWGAVVESEIQNEYDAITKNHFLFNYVVGRGGFGKVWKVEKKKNKKLYAMKEMSKARIIQKRSVNSVMNQRKLLSQLKHPFLVNMSYAFQDQKNLYLIMDLLSGGDLRYHLAKRKRFTEEQTRFFIACIVTSLEYLHNNGILHRDVKPQNLIFDHRGFLRLTDLGIARVWSPENAQDTSGTPGYMAPEVMCRQNHGVAVDYFATGVIAYECMMGRRPYLGRSRKEIRDQILAKQVQVKRHEIPEGWSLEAVNFINKMIQRKPMNRLGLNGPNEVKLHPWLRDFPWDDLYNKRLRASYVPSSKEDNFDPRTCQEGWKDQEDPEVQKENQEMLRRKSVQDLFQGYYYDYTMIVPRQCYQSSAAMATPDTFTQVTAATTAVTKPTPVKSSTKIVSKTPSQSRPHSPVSHVARSSAYAKGSFSVANSTTNSPRSIAGERRSIHHQHSHSHSTTGSSTPSYSQMGSSVNRSIEKGMSHYQGYPSSFQRGFKGTGSLRNSVFSGEEKSQKMMTPHHGYSSSAHQGAISKYMYQSKQ